MEYRIDNSDLPEWGFEWHNGYDKLYVCNLNSYPRQWECIAEHVMSVDMALCFIHAWSCGYLTANPLDLLLIKQPTYPVSNNQRLYGPIQHLPSQRAQATDIYQPDFPERIARVHIKNALYPQFKFMWIPQTQGVFVHDEPQTEQSIPKLGEAVVIGTHMDREAYAFGVVQTWCRGRRAKTKVESYAASRHSNRTLLL